MSTFTVHATRPDQALQRTRPSRPGCNPRLSRAGSRSLGSSGLMRSFLLFAILVTATRLPARPPEFPIPGSVSTKLDRELVLIPSQDDPSEPQAISVTVRHAKSHEIIASDTFFPFGVLTEVDPRMRAV